MNAKNYLLCSAFALLGICLSLSPAMAACTISITSVSFGAYDVFSSVPFDTTGSVTYRCGPQDKNIMITLDRGGASSFNPRRMLQGTQPLNYNLFLDAARTIIWGDGTGGTQFYGIINPLTNQNVTVTIFGRIPAGQDVSSGSYTNAVTATINF
jgi:spore coat protein U-like protein